MTRETAISGHFNEFARFPAIQSFLDLPLFSCLQLACQQIIWKVYQPKSISCIHISVSKLSNNSDSVSILVPHISACIQTKMCLGELHFDKFYPEVSYLSIRSIRFDSSEFLEDFNLPPLLRWISSFQPSLQSFGAANISDVDRGRVLTFFCI